MAVARRTISLNAKGDTDIINITAEVANCLKSTKLKNGVVVVFVSGSTGALTTVEYEPGLIKDLSRFFEEVASKRKEYAHNQTWGDGNGHAHVRASLLGPSLTVPFSNGEMELGVWQQVIFIDFDNRPRTRELILQIIGE